ncbi:MAG: UDP-N-acetylglucosamine 1-carboxyvinyltransferase [Spirochaetia bacterium]|nr:UDP-N-acetylglucosamine 1-carboxyvinyltransferase [Spirochaetia bacterium]MBQ3647221.1 UDP-N-acetylglucosamine 1-carboxyvinyltransferase [Spirochaetia bacterium]MBQ3713211.1 UDP-N-acetylglucosamine 1-carboxyvinyltransferase [Spirochaetia bacterium]MBQ6674433.1 UDP-N-acetylglucosamine 1-carboxyvinyltransferase [Spirochaetia bacterium]MBQ6905307.1 UDP-N-acetylglucosamine 1-carboxyvinyltransferase [Spirochaetia bacterium]
MDKYVIEGSYPLKGKIRASGNKNAALPCLAAALLTDEEVILENIPEIEDVSVMVRILKQLGSKVTWLGTNKYSIKTTDIKKAEIPAAEAKAVRASILFAGPLLARTGGVTFPPPGGDVIGHRRLDTHFLAFTELGARVSADGVYKVTANKLVGVDLFLDEASVTATENAVMTAVLAEGKTVIQNAASEPHVQDLCNMLVSMGAKIEGIGSNILYITGVEKLHGTQFRIGSDFMEVGSYIGLAAVTHSKLEIIDAEPKNLRMAKIAFGKLGINWETSGNSILVRPRQELRVKPDMGDQIPQIDDAPWPGFPPDLTSIITVVATQVTGTVLIHEKMFESRMFFVDKLVGMGAKIVLCDPHRAVVSGPASLKGSDMVSPDVRAGMAMVIAALCAEGKSTIHNIYQIERGYENLAAKLKSLGAKIERLPE